MQRRVASILALLVVALSGVIGLVLALEEVEPNDSPGEANDLPPGTEVMGAIAPAGDIDYYAIGGVNVTWGFIALLETESANQATLTALGNDGSTVLQTSTDSWINGTGIALQNYADGGAIHYLRVNEAGDDVPIPTYTLRHYRTVVNIQPEIEPNETLTTATISAFTHAGVLSTLDDVDCYVFYGRLDDTILLAVNGDPEGDGSPVDATLTLVGPGGAVLETAERSGVAGNEFIEYTGLSQDGKYAYCVEFNAGSAGPNATYWAGLVRNGNLYTPGYKQAPIWLNPGPRGVAYISDTLSFRLAITNTSPITIPGDIDLRAQHDAACLEFSDATPTPTNIRPDEVEWIGLKEGLAPGEVYSVTVDFVAKSLCTSNMHQSTSIRYYFTGTGSDASYAIHTPVFLPTILRP